jgi:ribosomal protein S18 acetylase RimI-like enzyme
VAVTIRAATVADARGIAEVHVEGWRWGYRGLLPDEVLDALDVEARAARWVTILGSPSERDACAVASDEHGSIVGFAATGAADDDFVPPPEGAGELFALYLREGWQRQGIGRSLLDRARSDLAGHGFDTAVLWVFEANARARSVYEAGGWLVDGATASHRFDCGARLVVRYQTTLGP